MTYIDKLSISWIDELKVSNNQLEIKAIALDKVIKIKCDGVIFLSINYPQDYLFFRNEEIGNVVDVSHKYRLINEIDIPKNPYNYKLDKCCNIINIEGDYIINLVCDSITVIEVGIYNN